MSIRKILASLSAFLLVVAPGFADQTTEDYVRENANFVLASLTEPGLSSAERRVKFQEYIEQFTDIDKVARQNLTRTYINRFSEEEMAEYLSVFRAYALAVYEDYFDRYKGEGIEVLGSIDRDTRRSIVNSKITSDAGEELEISWFVFKFKDRYLVMDLGLKLNGQMVWLLAEQQAQFKAILGRPGATPQTLIERIKEMTAEIVAKRNDVDADGNIIEAALEDVEAAEPTETETTPN